MAFHVNPSAASAAGLNHAADGAAHSAVANPPRTGSSSIFRRVMGAYVGFNLKALSFGMRAFSSPRAGSESSIDQNALMKSIFDQAKHRISGNQGAFEAALRRMQEQLDAAAAQPAACAAPQARPQSGPPPSSQPTPPQEAPHAANAQPADPARAEHDHQQHARRQAEQHNATQMRRTFQDLGHGNALSLLDGHAAPGGPGHTGHHTAPAGGADAAALMEAFRAQRQAFDAWMARPPSRTETDNG